MARSGHALFATVALALRPWRLWPCDPGGAPSSLGTLPLPSWGVFPIFSVFSPVVTNLCQSCFKESARTSAQDGSLVASTKEIGCNCMCSVPLNSPSCQPYWGLESKCQPHFSWEGKYCMIDCVVNFLNYQFPRASSDIYLVAAQLQIVCSLALYLKVSICSTNGIMVFPLCSVGRCIFGPSEVGWARMGAVTLMLPSGWCSLDSG
jgi:hypothetical protein